MCISEKYQRLLSLSEIVIKLHKLKYGRGYLTQDEKNTLRNAEAAIDRMNREHKSNEVKQANIFR